MQRRSRKRPLPQKPLPIKLPVLWLDVDRTEPSLTDEMERIIAREPAEVRSIKHPCIIERPSPRANQPPQPTPLANVRHADYSRRPWVKKIDGAPQRRPGVNQVLEYVCSNKAVERCLRQRRIVQKRLDIGHDHSIEPRTCVGGVIGIDLDTHHHGVLPPL